LLYGIIKREKLKLKTRIFLPRIGGTSVLKNCLLLILICLGGCPSIETEKAEHHTPDHMPADYPTAVDRLLALRVEIANADARDAGDVDVFAEAYDIVRWLPMLAADSDLKEEPWNVVYATAGRIEKILVEVVAGDGDKRRKIYLQYDAELEQLHGELVKVKQEFQIRTP